MDKITQNMSITSPLCRNNSNKWFGNLTDIYIPNDIVELLSLGYKFNYKSILDKENTIKTIKTVKEVFARYIYNNKNFDEDEVNIIRHNVINSLQHSNNKKIKHIGIEDRNFARKLKDAKVFSKNSNVSFAPADKGTTTVAMTRDSYMHQMHSLLSDASTYKVVNSK